ncbi:MAG: putative HTH-type transcriptional regulator [Rhodospirillales bacterium]|nr:putative HTH-type transcriptional regulator [Rhodospirillales bacterium]
MSAKAKRRKDDEAARRTGFSKAEGLQSVSPVQLSSANRLEAAIGQVVRSFRKQSSQGIAELAKLAGLSAGMLSKIENGTISPSLATLQALSRALQVPVTALFRDFEEVRDTTFVRDGEGLLVSRDGPRIRHEYRILGHTTSKRVAIEPYLMSFNDPLQVFPVYQRSGSEFIYVLEGELSYRHGSKLFSMAAGDSLLFEADVPHGPEQLSKTPVPASSTWWSSTRSTA